MATYSSGGAMKPLVVAMKGHPGTGKSTLAESIAKSLKWPLIDKDDARDCLSMLLQAQCESEPESKKTKLRKQLNALSYDIMFRIAETQLRIGLGVIIVCPLAWPWLFEQCRSIASRNCVQMAVVECICSDGNLWKKRVEGRADSALLLADGDSGTEESNPVHSKREEWADGIRSILDVGAAVWWHKPQKWEELKINIARYRGWSDYDTGSVKKLVIDTAHPSCSADSMKDRVLEWLNSITCEEDDSASIG